jgi:hypothetical protein
VSGSEQEIALRHDRFTTADALEEPPSKIPDSPVSKSPPRMLRNVDRFLREFNLSKRRFKNKYF